MQRSLNTVHPPAPPAPPALPVLEPLRAVRGPLRVEVTERGTQRVIAIVGEAGVWSSLPLQGVLRAVAAQCPSGVVIDLSECTMLSSVAIASIIELSRSMRPRAGTIRMAAARPAVAEILDTLRLGQLFPLHPTVDEALAAPAPRATAC